jgi:hypothetical protein
MGVVSVRTKKKALRRHNTSVFEQFARGAEYLLTLAQAIREQVVGDADRIGDNCERRGLRHRSQVRSWRTVRRSRIERNHLRPITPPYTAGIIASDPLRAATDMIVRTRLESLVQRENL